ncbi:MAG: hypothetical protein H8E21_03105 [Gammaproteobacteria bacterium]|nr:hypothetical protein [Gammaproteobacteria bacterium]MBL7000634.1 hypothetical protein [Gammaproteobacteria bacterium]
MKKLNLAIILALGLSVPLTAISAENFDVNKHAMEMHEKSQESVMKKAQISDAASQKGTGTGSYQYRSTERHQYSSGPGTPQGPAYAGGEDIPGKKYEGDDIPGEKYQGDQTPGNKYGTGSGKGADKGSSNQSGKTSQQKLKKQTGDDTGVQDRDRDRDQDRSMIRDQDQDRDMERDQDRTMERDQDQIRDTDHVFEQEPAMEQNVVPEPPMQQEQNEVQNVPTQKGK